MKPDYWTKAKSSLKRKDPTLKAIISAYKGELMVTKGDAFYTLARAIAGQQISVKAAASVWKRIEELLGEVTPKAMGNAPAEKLRFCGLSERKVIYMHSLANHFLENKNIVRKWKKMTDDEIIKDLTQIKGIGRWTAEMFLIFHLARPDVFPIDDLGLLKGIYRHYNDGKKMPREEVLAVGERWRPYRSVGTWYMWRALDPLPVAY